MSETASGTIAGVLTFSHRKTGQQVRFQNKQKDVITESRTAQRTAYLAGVDSWNNLSPSEKAQWTRNAKGQNLTGFNLYLSIFLSSYSPDFVPAFYGQAIFGNSVFGQFST